MNICKLLKHYAERHQPDRVEPLPDNTGFSGASIARLHTPAGEFCLRGWPAGGLPRQRLLGLHRLLAEIARRSDVPVAVPVVADNGTTLVTSHGRLWQLEPWLPGKADFWQHPGEPRLSTAMRCLANWHRAAATFQPRADEARWFASRASAPSPAVHERLDRIRRDQSERCPRIRRALDVAVDSELREIGRAILDGFDRAAATIAAELNAAEATCYRLQPCLRDVWHDHVLFTDDAVTGLIDASACRSENVATDLARLLGSFLGDDRATWDTALDVYRTSNPLSLDELALVRLLDRSSVLLSGLFWLDQIFLQGRRFSQPPRVVRLLQRIQDRLTHLCQSF